MRHINSAVLLLAATILSGTSAAHAAPKPGRAASHTTAPAPAAKPIIVVKTISPEIREISYANPPLNFIEPQTIVDLNQTVLELSKDDQIKVVIFTSGVDGFFYNHFDLAQFPAFAGQVTPAGKPLWVELISNIQKAPFITIGSIHGRAQGGGDELMLALDLRYASREKAVFNQPEVGIGLFPGGGGPEHLVRLAGRDRALEAYLSADDYDAEIAERYGWITRAIPDADLDAFVNRLATRLASFDKTALLATKHHIDDDSLPTEAERLESNQKFTQSLSWPGLQPRAAQFGNIMAQKGALEVETRMGYYIGEGNRQLQESSKK